MSESCEADPLVGRCPRCRNASPQIAYYAAGISNIVHPEWITDWDSYALCHNCHTLWRVGTLLDPPPEGTLLLQRGDQYSAYEQVFPLEIAENSAAAYFASYLWAKQRGLDPDALGSEACERLMADDMKQ